MLSQRMRSRIPSATVMATGKVVDWRLVCNKRGRDGTGKANLVHSPGDIVWGVLYAVAAEEMPSLDRIEAGYTRRSLTVLTRAGEMIGAEAYFADKLLAEPLPYRWYKELMVKGAHEHRLPRAYIDSLSRLPSK
jgi:gamma-glutamylcyclotransferase